MKKAISLMVAWLILAVSGCTSAAATTEPKAAFAPIQIQQDLAKVNLCQAIPSEDIEAVLGRKLVSAPTPYEYDDAAGTSGCSYDAGKDSAGNSYFGYVVLTPVEVYDHQPLTQDIHVGGLGQSAYFNDGADARQLWVKVDDQVAFVVAFGDLANEEGATSIARLLLAAIQ